MTETLLDWGVEPVACTRFCEQPDLPQVGGTKNPDLDGIAALAPELVVMDAEENRLEDYEALVRMGLEVASLRIRSLVDVGSQLEPLAARIGVDWVAQPLGDPAPIRTTAFVPIWRRPWMALGTGTYGSSLLAHLGIGSPFEHEDGPYPQVSLEAVATRQPGLVLAPSEPYAFGEKHRGELESVGQTVFVDGKDLLWWGTRTPDAMKRLAGLAG